MTNTAPSRAVPGETAIRRRGLLGGLHFEAGITVRMLVDDASSAILPPVLFTAAVCSHYRLDAADTMRHLGVNLLLFTLYLYIFDASNQARGAREDALNKPYRPIPAGLITSKGMTRRLWCALPLYTLLGWATGTLPWVLLWQAVVLAHNLLSSPRYYVVFKPIAMTLGIVAQLAAAWSSVAPLDRVGWSWVLVLAFAYNVPLPFEDVRDMAGDRQIGRRTLPLMTGHWPVRIWFAVNMALLPLVLHILLFAPTHPRQSTLFACDLVVAALTWTAGATSLLVRTVRADRFSYLVYTFSYAAALACGYVLL